MSDLVERVARAIIGPRNPVPEGSPYTLDELRAIRWDQQATRAEKDAALWQARAAIAAIQTDAEPVAWMYERDGRKHVSPSRITSPRDAFAGWTETPLYAHPPIAAPAPIYRHKKRGTLYTVIGEAELQTATRRPAEGDELVIYRGEDGKLWAREHTEFHDGRFKPTDNVDTPCTAPALKPAVEVWREASDAATDGSVKYQSHADQAAAAVIEADRQAIIAAKDAQIAALQAHADALAGAVTLAANRLARCALEPEYGTEQSYEWREWSDEARQALRAYEEFRR